MLKEKYVPYYLTNIFLDAMVAILSLAIAYYLRGWMFILDMEYDFLPFAIPGLYRFSHYSWLLPIMIPLWPVLMDINGAYSSMRFDDLKKVCWIIFKTVAQATILLILFMFLFKIEEISRTFIITIAAVSFVLLLLKELMVRVYFHYKNKGESGFRNILVIGKGEECMKIIKALNHYSFWGLRIKGIVSTCEDDKDNLTVPGIPVIGKLTDISEILVKNHIDEVIFTSHPIEIKTMQNILEECEELGIKSLIPLNYFDLKIAKTEFEHLHNIPILAYTTTSTNVMDLFFKYLLDRIIAFLIIIMISPVMVTIALIIKFTSKGPILFRQVRSGLYGRPFVFYKFRSMYIDAEEKLKELQKFNEMEGPVFKMKNDPRVTPFGRFIRKTSLDELPQLFNVLKGEMSLVGPRPPLPKEVEQYKRWQRRKLSMKPGITCVWQVSGRNEITDFDQWMKLDLWYIDNWSLWLDFNLLFRTVYVVLTMQGAR